MSAQKNHLDDSHLYGATSAPVSHEEHSSGPSAAFNRQAESASLAAQYEAPRSNPNAQVCSHTSCHLERVSSFVCSHSYTSGCCGNAFQSTGSSPSHLSLPHSDPFPNRNDPTTSTITDNSLHCNICDTKFTGQYGRGNLARHVKHKHAKASKVPHMCRLAACPKVFARSDARQKHERKQHPWLHPEPVERRSYNAVSHRETAVDTITTAMAGPVPHVEESTTHTATMFQPIYLRESYSQLLPTLDPSSPHEPSQISNTDRQTAPAMSAQSSNQGFNNHGSSQYYLTPHTGPLSVHDSVDNMLLSPSVPTYSIPSAPHTSDSLGHTLRQGMEPDYQAFPEAYPQSEDPLFIDPRVLDHHAEDFDILNDDIEGYVNDNFGLLNDDFEG